jgi:Zn-dependent peptidase ImmA (M78 family)
METPDQISESVDNDILFKKTLGTEEDLSLTPDAIGDMITEHVRPGSLGLLAEEAAAEDQIDYGVSIQTIQNLAQHLQNFSKELYELAQVGAAAKDKATAIKTIRDARLKMAEIIGAATQSKEQSDALAAHYRLPDIRV